MDEISALDAVLRDRRAVRHLIEDIHKEVDGRSIRLMHVCGSHEHTVTRFGLRALLPPTLELISGPGCPVCVCGTADIREAIDIARKGAVLTTFGDMMRDRTPWGSLESARQEGLDVRVVYSPLDALRLARDNPTREVVFFGVGFETTAAPVASLFQETPPANFSLLASFKLTSPAVAALLDAGGRSLQGLVCPGHVSTIVGAVDWKVFPEKYGVPAVVSGFEPTDLLLATRALVRQVRSGRAELENEYTRLVRFEGNPAALRMLREAFEVRDSFWRGVGVVPRSGLFLREVWRDHDARARFGVNHEPQGDKDLPKGCQCHKVVVGDIYPPQCPLFGTKCTPQDPYGPCMVSVEGTCYIWQRFGDPRMLQAYQGRGA